MKRKSHFAKTLIFAVITLLILSQAAVLAEEDGVVFAKEVEASVSAVELDIGSGLENDGVNETQTDIIEAAGLEVESEIFDPYKEVSCSDSGFIYSDEMLLKDARELSTDLAKASAVLAEAAYGNGSTTNTLIVDTLSSYMGYNCDDYGSYAKINSLTVWDNDHVGFVVGKKVYKDKVLYCVPIKGTSANAEWHSDFHSGDPGENDGFHKGFYRAAQDVMTALQSSFAQDGGRERVIWLTGHSRGAAVANLVAGLLTDSQTYASTSRIFCYTFACPAVGLSSRVSGYPNIVNYINIGDPIPMMPLESWGYARYGRDIKQDLNSLPNFLRNFKAWKNDAYCGASREDDWLGLLQQIVPERDSNMILREMLAYFLGGKNDITFTSFSAYMLSEYSYDLAKLGVKAVTKNTLIGDFIDMIETVIETEENMQKDLDRFWDEYNSAEDADERQAVFSRYSGLFGNMEKLLNVTIDTVSDINPAQVKLLDYLNTARAMIETLNSAVGLLVDTDGHFVTAIEHAHHHRTYILWINSWYCGYDSWRGTDITNPATVSECRLDECNTIGVRAFQDCTSISSLSFPSNLAYIGASAFSGVKYIDTLILPDTLEAIGSYAFSNCTGLTSVTLPIQASLTRVFASTNNVKTIHYTAGRTGAMPDRGDNSSYDNYYCYSLEYAAKESLEEITFDEGVTHIGSYAFEGDNIKRLTGGKLPSTLESVGANAFYGNKLMAIDGLPAGLTSLGYYSFYNSGLTNFVMPVGITDIPYYCFYGCKGMTVLEIPNWVISIGKYAFDSCTGLESVTLPIERSAGNIFKNCASVKTIHYTVQGDGAMPDRGDNSSYDNYYCYSLEYAAKESLEEITFDEGVTHIGSYAFEGDNIKRLTGGKLPSTLKSIGDRAFYGNKLMAIDGLPAGLMSLGYYSFYNSGLTNFVMPEGITDIPYYCFYGCRGMTVLEIPNWVISIGRYAFDSCTGLESVTLPIERSGGNIFKNCVSVKTIHYTVQGDGAMPDRGDNSSYDNYYCYSLEYAAKESLEEITFDEGVTHIGSYAFEDDNIKRLTGGKLPSTLESVGANAFYGNKLMAIDGLPAGLTSLGVYSFYNSGLTNFVMPEGITDIPSYCFYGCKGMTALEIPNWVISIGRYAFDSCTGLESVTLPIERSGGNIFRNCASVKTIHYTVQGDGAMPDRGDNSSYDNYYCYSLEYAAKESLEEITFDEGVTHIGSYAFEDDNIKRLTGGKLPSTLKSIGDRAFYGNKLMAIDGLPAGLMSLGYYSFYNSGLTNFVMPEGITDIPSYCFYGCKGMTAMEIPNWVISIGRYAFDSCTGLESVTLPIERSAGNIFRNCASVKTIHYTVQGDGVMPDRGDSSSYDNYYCYSLEYAAKESLEAVTFDEGVTRIADYAFYNCSAMTINGLPSSLKSLGTYSFSNTGISNFVIPDGVKEIPSYCFNSCRGLTALEIPNWVISIGSYAFDSCTGLEAVTLPIERSGGNIFRNCASVKTIHYTVQGDGAMPDRGDNSSYDNYYCYSLEYAAKESLEEITFDEGVTHIASYAFEDDNIKRLTGGKLPSTLESVGANAFYGNALMAIDGLPAGLTSLGVYSFYNSGLTNFVMPEGITAIPSYCFYGCRGMTVLEIPNWVISIGSYAFDSCTGLESVTLPIERSACNIFKNCTGVRSIHYTVQGDGAMPDRVSSSSYNNYYYYSLEHAAKESLEAVIFDEGVTHIGSYAFCWNDGKGLAEFQLPNSIRSIGSYAFSGQSKLFTVEFGDVLEQIGDHAFDNTGLNVIIFNGDAPQIGTSFTGVTADAYYVQSRVGWFEEMLQGYGGNLNWIALGEPMSITRLPANMDIIGKEAFIGTGLQMVIVPDGASVIQIRAFADCQKLRQIYIPSSVYAIARSAFSGCDSNMAIVGKSGSAAESYAKANGFRFFNLDGQ